MTARSTSSMQLIVLVTQIFIVRSSEVLTRTYSREFFQKKNRANDASLLSLFIKKLVIKTRCYKLSPYDKTAWANLDWLGDCIWFNKTYKLADDSLKWLIFNFATVLMSAVHWSYIWNIQLSLTPLSFIQEVHSLSSRCCNTHSITPFPTVSIPI